ncbi:hypothetical protein ACFQQB_25410 [Nonomuraea rubra]|uniref:hypothetical protein n=1 Tax=Nonomuraea rubra TaxID=46180 RepID=UPI003609E39E
MATCSLPRSRRRSCWSGSSRRTSAYGAQRSMRGRPWDFPYRHLPGNVFALGAVVVCMTMLSVVWLSYGTALKVGGVMSELGDEGVVELADPAVSHGRLDGVPGRRHPVLAAGGGPDPRPVAAVRTAAHGVDRSGEHAGDQDLCRFYAFVAGGLAVTVLVFEVLAAVYARWQQSEVAANVVIALPVLTVVVALYVGVWPFVVIARLVRDHLDHLLDPVRAQMRRPPAALLTTPGSPRQQGAGPVSRYGCSTDRMFPEGSVNQAIAGPSPLAMPRSS